jgi:Arc/MetJ-type ribon-helix-helix transcriptional regulator
MALRYGIEHKARNLTITLPHEMVVIVREAAATGFYGGISEIIREALRDWRLKQVAQAAKTAHTGVSTTA